jgi:hypothetical protein
LKSRRTLATNRPRLDHLAVSCNDKKRDHPSQGKIHSIDKLAGFEADRASLQRDLPQVLSKQFKSLARQGAQEPIAPSRYRQQLSGHVGINSNGMPSVQFSTGNHARLSPYVSAEPVFSKNCLKIAISVP